MNDDLRLSHLVLISCTFFFPFLFFLSPRLLIHLFRLVDDSSRSQRRLARQAYGEPVNLFSFGRVEIRLKYRSFERTSKSSDYSPCFG